MAGITYGEALAKANALDEAEGPYVCHRGNAVICEMLQKAFGPDGAKERKAVQEREVAEHRQILKKQQLARANRMIGSRTSGAQAPRDEGGQGGSGVPVKKKPVAPLMKAAARRAGAEEHNLLSDDAKVALSAAGVDTTWTPERVEAALNDGVLRGKISGTAAMAALNAFKAACAKRR